MFRGILARPAGSVIWRLVVWTRLGFGKDGVVPKGATLGSFRKWCACGVLVCGKQFASLLGISETRLSKIKQQVLAGHFEPPVVGNHRLSSVG
jgi:hypothetical protein